MSPIFIVYYLLSVDYFLVSSFFRYGLITLVYYSTTAKDWYAAQIAEWPGTGKLHHHLRLLLREVEGKELWGVYCFMKRYFRFDFF